MRIRDENLDSWIDTVRRMKEDSKNSTAMWDTLVELFYFLSVIFTLGFSVFFEKRPTPKSYIHGLFFLDRYMLHPGFTSDGKYSKVYRDAKRQSITKNDHMSPKKEEKVDATLSEASPSTPIRKKKIATPSTSSIRRMRRTKKTQLYDELLEITSSFPDGTPNKRLAKELKDQSRIYLRDDTLCTDLYGVVKKTNNLDDVQTAIDSWIEELEDRDFKRI